MNDWPDKIEDDKPEAPAKPPARQRPKMSIPDQALFMRENLKLKLLNARLGLLARHMQSSQADLAAVEAALARYYDTNSPRVTAAQSTLARLRKDLVSSDLPRPDETLTALAAAAGGR